MMAVHMMVSVQRVGSDTEAKTECGLVMHERTRADVWKTMTAWPSLTTCPLCKAGFHADS